MQDYFVVQKICWRSDLYSSDTWLELLFTWMCFDCVVDACAIDGCFRTEQQAGSCLQSNVIAPIVSGTFPADSAFHSSRWWTSPLWLPTSHRHYGKFSFLSSYKKFHKSSTFRVGKEFFLFLHWLIFLRESELVSGFNIEYFRGRFILIF